MSHTHGERMRVWRFASDLWRLASQVYLYCSSVSYSLGINGTFCLRYFGSIPEIALSITYLIHHHHYYLGPEYLWSCVPYTACSLSWCQTPRHRNSSPQKVVGLSWVSYDHSIRTLEKCQQGHDYCLRINDDHHCFHSS